MCSSNGKKSKLVQSKVSLSGFVLSDYSRCENKWLWIYVQLYWWTIISKLFVTLFLWALWPLMRNWAALERLNPLNFHFFLVKWSFSVSVQLVQLLQVTSVHVKSSASEGKIFTMGHIQRLFLLGFIWNTNFTHSDASFILWAHMQQLRKWEDVWPLGTPVNTV